MPIFGAATNLVGGTITLTKPPGHRSWYIQNQDIAPLKITFPGSGGSPVVGAASALGAEGGWLDNKNFPYPADIVVLTSTIATHQFSSGSTNDPPYDTIEVLRR